MMISRLLLLASPVLFLHFSTRDGGPNGVKEPIIGLPAVVAPNSTNSFSVSGDFDEANPPSGSNYYAQLIPLSGQSYSVGSTRFYSPSFSFTVPTGNDGYYAVIGARVSTSPSTVLQYRPTVIEVRSGTSTITRGKLTSSMYFAGDGGKATITRPSSVTSDLTYLKLPQFAFDGTTSGGDTSPTDLTSLTFRGYVPSTGNRVFYVVREKVTGISETIPLIQGFYYDTFQYDVPSAAGGSGTPSGTGTPSRK